MHLRTEKSQQVFGAVAGENFVLIKIRSTSLLFELLLFLLYSSSFVFSFAFVKVHAKRR